MWTRIGTVEITFRASATVLVGGLCKGVYNWEMPSIGSSSRGIKSGVCKQINYQILVLSHKEQMVASMQKEHRPR